MGSPDTPVRRVVVGLGTGRCGTHSLAHLLSLQHDTTSLHQPDPCLPWHTDHGWYGSARRVIASQTTPVVAVVAWYYLNYTALLARDHDARFVCLRRDRDATIRSIERLTEGIDNWSNRPVEESATGRYRHLFPQYDVDDKRAALVRYYDEYYDLARQLEAADPRRFRVFRTEELNDDVGVEALLRFAGFEEPVVRSGIREGRLEHYRWRGEPDATD